MANISSMILERLNGGAPTLSPAASLYAKDKDEEEKKKNRGGILGGLGYVGEKLGLGLLQGIEGVWDYAAGGIADLFGADAWAEQQFSSDWLNYNHADDWYNPGEGWKIAGDVTGGIGTSLPGILTAAGITLATGGSGAAAGVGLAVGSLSAAGTSTKEAMQESGELTGKEYLYGAGMGAVEAVTEKLSGGLGAGVTKAAKSIGKAFGKVAAKETAEAAAKSAAKKGVALSLKTAAKSAGKEFASEAFEEGFSEWVAPYIARATYDPNAQSATGEEILYSAFIGGLSGVGTAGGVGAFVQRKNVKSGTVIADEGRAKQILDLAKQYMEDGFSNTEDAQGIREIYEKLAPAVERGEALNIEQRRMLGELNSFEVEEQLRPTLQRSALTAVNGADAIAERLNADGRYKMVDDKFTYVDSEKSIPEGATVREITAEDITKGYDPSKKDSIREAIQKNDVLRYIAASDAAGRFIMTAKDFEKAALSGQKIQSQADLNLFIENASAEQKAAVGKELGVTDWNTLNIEGFNERAAAYRESGKAEAYKQKTAKIEKMKQLADSKPKSIPRAIALSDGDVKHYADADSNIAIARTGDTFLVYDYNTGNVTRDMTRAEVNAELARYRQSKSATTETTNATTETTNATSEKTSENFSSDAEIEIKDRKISKTAFENEFSEEKSRPTVKEIKAANEAKEQAKRFDALAKEKIKDYDGLSEANKSMIRKIFREAEANGISEADALSYARVSARTGLDITFDKKACYKGKNEAGEDVYHAGFYDPENNRIVVNPETKKKHTVLLIHELSHAMRSYRKNVEVKYFIDADAKVSEKMWKEIRKYYADENGNVDEGLTLDEASAYYAEAIFGTEGAIDLLLGEKPTLKQKILSFFAKSAEYYSTDEKLSKEARRHFRKFKAMFDAFTARNYGRNAETGLTGDTKARRYSFAGTNAETADRMNLSTAEKMLADGVDPETVRKETGWFKGYDGNWRFEIDDSVAVWNLDSAKPDSKRLFEFGEHIYKLGDILDHPELYEAYPELKEATVLVNPAAKTGGYVVGRSTDSFVIRSLADTNLNKDIIIHEVQHLIQNIEGFASGASIEQFSYKAWGEKEFAAYEKRNEIASKLYAILRRHGVSIPKADADAVRTAFEVRDSIIDYNFMLIESLADNNARTRNLLDQYYAQVQVLNLTTPEGQYHAVAGEVESYDVQARRNMSAEERKNTQPNTDREDVIIVDNQPNSYVIVELDNGMQYVQASESQVITGNNPDEWSKQVAHYINTSIRGGNDFVIKTEQGDFLTITRDTTYKSVSKDQIKNPDGTYRVMTDAEYKTKLNASVHINEIAQVSRKWNRPNVLDSKNHKFAKDGFSYRTAYFKDFDGSYYRLTISVGENGSVSTVYNVGKIKKDSLPNGKIKTIYKGSKANSESNDISILDSEPKVNTSDENSSKKSSESGKRASMDSNYMSAVERGDMVTAQRMVDEAYSYESLTEKSDLSVVTFPTELPMTENGKVDTNAVVARGRLNARKQKNPNNTETSTYVRVDDIGLDVLLSKNGMTHGIARSQETAFAVMKIGDVLKNSVAVNELNGSATRKTEMSYVLLGACRDSENLYVVRSVVSKLENNVTEIDVYQLSAVKGKKTETPTSALGGTAVTEQSSLISSESPVVSIADFLEYVKTIPISNEVFSEDVAKKLGVDRSKGTLTQSLRYSSETIENVGKSRFDEPDVKFREKIKAGFVSAKDKLYIEAVDELYGVEKYLTKFGGRKDAESFVQQVRASETISQTMIGVAQYDITNDNGKRLGDGLTKIFKKYKVRGISDYFDDYLLHQLNVDRMTLNERSLAWKEELRLEYEKAQKAYDKAKKLVEEKKKKSVPRKIGTALTAARNAYESFEVLENKPVFGENEKRAKAITAEESRKIIAEYEKEHPEFKDSAEEVWAYSKNLQAMRVSSGLISQESADIMAKYYPHYVPSFRDKTKSVGAGTVKNASQLAVNSTIKKAKGGGEDIYSVEESLAAQTRQTVKAMQINRMANAVYEAAISSGDTSYVMTKEAEKQMKNTDPDADDVIDLVAKNNQIVFFRDGKKMEMNVAQEIFDGFKGVTSGSVPDSLAVRMSSKVLGGFKNLVTQLSPAFAVRNFVRDLQDALINTKHPRKFIKQLKGALSDMATNGNEWQLYLAYGGFASTVFDAKGFTHGVGERGFEAFRQISGIDESSFKKIGKGLKNVLTVVGNANAFIEQLTRFMEFKASLAAGDSIQTAINNSAEVTTNFSRHGKVVKVLNATFIPFLNASVQGFDKLLRVISGPFKEQSLAAIAILFAKILAIGIAPQILNMLMYGDEEDYEDLTNEVRENYFLIKAGDQYIKIPRGRAAGAFGGIANRIGNVTRGDSFDLPGYLESLKNNVTPLDSFTRDIFSPFRDVATNTTWYGGEIEGRQFENVRPSQRYDESTSSIAVALGGAFNYSPKKIHYLLDQYSGVIGDFLLPVTTKKAEKDYLSANFLIDPKTNNKLSDEFYKLYDDAQFAKNDGDETAYYQLRHLNDVKDSVSKLYDDIESIQKSNKKNSDKLNEVRTIRALINNLYKTAKTDYAAYTKAIEATAGMFDETTESGKRLRHTVITKMMYGSEKALEEYNSDVYEKSQLFNKAGMSYDTFYEYYFTTKFIEPDTDRRGEKIEGSKRKNTIAAINKLNATREEKLLMIVASGYALKDGDIRGISAANAKRMLLKYILSMKGTQAEKAALAEACGFEVKNGKILKNSL